MIVRSLNDITDSCNDVSGPGWRSRRLLLASDGMGYSMSDTIIYVDCPMVLEYKHHFEACYCIEGSGTVTAEKDGVPHTLEPFKIYALDQNDRHTLTATGGQMRLICVFSPALTGQEVHNADGSYPIAE